MLRMCKCWIQHLHTKTDTHAFNIEIMAYVAYLKHAHSTHAGLCLPISLIYNKAYSIYLEECRE